MSSFFKKIKKKKNIDYVAGEKCPGPSNKHYYPYHEALQKHIDKIDNDHQYIMIRESKKEYKEKVIGTFKRKYDIDSCCYIDEEKDGAY